MVVVLTVGAEPVGPAVESGPRGGGRSALAGRAAAGALYIAGNHVTGFFVCWPPPLVNVLALSALRAGDARALDLSLAASHRA